MSSCLLGTLHGINYCCIVIVNTKHVDSITVVAGKYTKAVVCLAWEEIRKKRLGRVRLVTTTCTICLGANKGDEGNAKGAWRKKKGT